jgi:hypothetical protein
MKLLKKYLKKNHALEPIIENSTCYHNNFNKATKYIDCVNTDCKNCVCNKPIIVIHDNYKCKILKDWDGFYFDLETIEPTKLGFIEKFLSVHISELRKENDDVDKILNL